MRLGVFATLLERVVLPHRAIIDHDTLRFMSQDTATLPVGPFAIKTLARSGDTEKAKKSQMRFAAWGTHAGTELRTSSLL